MSLKKNESARSRFMDRAIAVARRGILAGQHPYGAAIVRNGRLLVAEHNTVRSTLDATAHAEVCAIRAACRKIHGVDLSGCEIYCTCEPCAMCMGACYFSGIGKIYFGAFIADKFAFGLPDLGVGASILSKIGTGAPKVTGGVWREKCVELFKLFLEKDRS